MAPIVGPIRQSSPAVLPSSNIQNACLLSRCLPFLGTTYGTSKFKHSKIPDRRAHHSMTQGFASAEQHCLKMQASTSRRLANAFTNHDSPSRASDGLTKHSSPATAENCTPCVSGSPEQQRPGSTQTVDIHAAALEISSGLAWRGIPGPAAGIVNNSARGQGKRCSGAARPSRAHV